MIIKIMYSVLSSFKNLIKTKFLSCAVEEKEG